MREDLLDIDQLAARLNTTPKAIRMWRYRGIAPDVVRVGRRIMWRPEDVDRWLDGVLTSHTRYRH